MGCNDYEPMTDEQRANFEANLDRMRVDRQSRVDAYAEEIRSLVDDGLVASLTEINSIIFERHLPDRGEIREAVRQVALSGDYLKDAHLRLVSPGYPPDEK